MQDGGLHFGRQYPRLNCPTPPTLQMQVHFPHGAATVSGESKIAAPNAAENMKTNRNIPEYSLRVVIVRLSSDENRGHGVSSQSIRPSTSSLSPSNASILVTTCSSSSQK